MPDQQLPAADTVGASSDLRTSLPRIWHTVEFALCLNSCCCPAARAAATVDAWANEKMAGGGDPSERFCEVEGVVEGILSLGSEWSKSSAGRLGPVRVLSASKGISARGQRTLPLVLGISPDQKSHRRVHTEPNLLFISSIKDHFVSPLLLQSPRCPCKFSLAVQRAHRLALSPRRRVPPRVNERSVQWDLRRVVTSAMPSCQLAAAPFGSGGRR